MAAYQVLLLNTAVPQIQAAQSGDTYVVPRDIAFSTVASFAAGTAAAPSIVATGDVNTGIWFPAADTIAFSEGGVESMRIDSSGNLGLGVTPSAWGSEPALELRQAASLFGFSGTTNLLQNAFYDGSNWIYKNTAGAMLFQVGRDGHRWFTAASGTAGNAITFTQAMTLDASGNLGVGTTSPTSRLDISGGATTTTLRVRQTAASSASELRFGDDAGTDGGLIIKGGSTYASYGGANSFMFWNNRSGPIVFGTNDTERARITSGGDFQTSSGGSVQVGGTAARATTAGTNRVDIFDGTAPVGTLANGVSFYSTAGEARVMDAAGNATLLSPHDTETNEWIFHSKHTPSGKVLRIDVERLLRFVNAHFGLDAVKEFVEE